MCCRASQAKEIKTIHCIDLNTRFLASQVLQYDRQTKVVFVLISVKGGILVLIEVDPASLTVKTRQNVGTGKSICGCLVSREDG